MQSQSLIPTGDDESFGTERLQQACPYPLQIPPILEILADEFSLQD